MYLISVTFPCNFPIKFVKKFKMAGAGGLLEVNIVGEGLGRGSVGQSEDCGSSVDGEVRTPDSGYSSVSSHSSRYEIFSFNHSNIFEFCGNFNEFVQVHLYFDIQQRQPAFMINGRKMLISV